METKNPNAGVWKELVQALRAIVVCVVPDGYDRIVYELVGLDPEQTPTLEKDEFGLVCAAAERAIFSKLLKEDRLPIPLKHLLEIAEFQRYRLENEKLNLTPQLDRFLDLISV
ncbi:unnamed protein product [Calicophoron daubneyi]|uniref:Uncharacterized protein n=1 Tax=Calicophoron daubneyi TaxID=300641 RepID=A0AAV2SXX8_CALDB